jgi:hypothetical protein
MVVTFLLGFVAGIDAVPFEAAGEKRGVLFPA